MRSLFLILLLLPFLTSAQNTCISSIPITVGIHVVDQVDGEQIPIPVCFGIQAATHGSWYRFTAPLDTTVVVNTGLFANPSTDTRFQVYTGTCASLVCVGGDDDSGPGMFAVDTFSVVQGSTYFIAFDDRWSMSGFSFELYYAPPPPPPVEGVVTFTSLQLPVYSECVVDMNGDHLDDAVGVTNLQVTIAEQLPGGGFQTVIIPTPLATHMPTWSIAAGDISGNGYNDLVYGGGSGATFMMRTDDGTGFTQQSFPQYIFSQRTNMIDLNNDGHLDAFVCHDVNANVYFLNNGNGILSFNQGGLGETAGNYGSIWTDYDNDGDMDLFVAKCGADPIDILMRNNGDGTFTDMAPGFGMADQHQSWSSAWGDFDNDGDMDVLIGTSAGGGHKLLRNDLGTFTNITSISGINSPSTSYREWITHDFDNNGWLDILGDQVLFLNNGDMTFSAQLNVPENGPIGDLNDDGFLDIVNGATARMNDGNDNHWLKVNTVGTISNTNGIGARITITSALGTQIREVRSGDGFAFMSSLTTHFGLGPDTEVYEVVIRWPSGVVNTITQPAIDQTILVTEDVSTGIAMSEIEELQLFPNPVDAMLTISGGIIPNSTIKIHDVTGREVLSTAFHGAVLDVSNLSPGVHTLQAITAAGPVHRKFVKE